ncbi:MAG: S41 family peptidase [Anaerolineae bacterium]|nr:MAG: S41 family peptidase [Anaerolineae bacterium]
MNRKTILYGALALFVAVLLCIGIASVGFLAYSIASSGLGVNAGAFSTVEAEQPGATIFQPTDLPPTETPVGAEIDLAELFRPYWEARQMLEDNYVQLPLDEAVLAQGALDGLTAALEAAGLDLASLEAPSDAPDPQTLAEEAGTPAEVFDFYGEYWAAWQKVTYAELEGDLTYEILMQESLRGMVSSLGDPHTSYMNPDEYYQTQVSLSGNYEGIGAWVDPTAEYLTIIAPIPGSPAEAAGLLPGDRIVAIDGDDMTGINGDLVIRRVLGPAGSVVVLTIDRDGLDEPFDVTITRAHITIPTTESEMLEGDIAYLHLFNFGADSATEFHDVLEELMAQNPRGLIIDLRNNGGGYLHSAVQITSEFIPRDEIVLYEEFGDGSRQEYESVSGGLALDIPIVILVNEGTASASEILAGALQDYDRAVLVGTVTFGKGSVQLPIELSDQQGALRVTIARWLTPDERFIQGIGLEPNHLVDVTEEDLLANRDPQLEFALDLLLNP